MKLVIMIRGGARKLLLTHFYGGRKWNLYQRSLIHKLHLSAILQTHYIKIVEYWILHHKNTAHARSSCRYSAKKALKTESVESISGVSGWGSQELLLL